MQGVSAAGRDPRRVGAGRRQTQWLAPPASTASSPPPLGQPESARLLAARAIGDVQRDQPENLHALQRPCPCTATSEHECRCGGGAGGDRVGRDVQPSHWRRRGRRGGGAPRGGGGNSRRLQHGAGAARRRAAARSGGGEFDAAPPAAGERPPSGRCGSGARCSSGWGWARRHAVEGQMEELLDERDVADGAAACCSVARQRGGGEPRSGSRAAAARAAWRSGGRSSSPPAATAAPPRAAAARGRATAKGARGGRGGEEAWRRKRRRRRRRWGARVGGFEAICAELRCGSSRRRGSSDTAPPPGCAPAERARRDRRREQHRARRSDELRARARGRRDPAGRVLALDRFGDWAAGDRAALVREAAAQALAALLGPMGAAARRASPTPC